MRALNGLAWMGGWLHCHGLGIGIGGFIASDSDIYCTVYLHKHQQKEFAPTMSVAHSHKAHRR